MKYTVGYHCTNCLFKAIVWFERGNLAESSYNCPNCGTGWLLKSRLDTVTLNNYRVVGGDLVSLAQSEIRT